ncbi:MAG: hypothetical protein HDT30_09195 [Clostridiales bacterium]|nr:hypothetical protein [Clostridiales bacterium]
MRKNLINHEGVCLYCPIMLECITKIRFEQKYGEHAWIEIEGILHGEEDVEKVYSVNMQDTILLKKKDKILFSGVPVKAELEKRGELYQIIITGNSKSILLDLGKQQKSYQKNTTFKEIFEDKIGNNGVIKMQASMEKQEKRQLYVQYWETDWEFMKRIASQENAQICPDINAEKNSIIVGVPKGREITDNFAMSELEKNIENFLKSQAEGQAKIDKEYMTLNTKSYKNYKIGDRFCFEGYHLVLAGISMQYTDGLLEYTYTWKHEKGMKCREKYNKKIKGSSIDGKIIKVERDRVKLHLCIDSSQSVSEAIFFPVAIGYTAEGSTGLYTAMDEGECVKLYFPSANEKDAYVRCVDKNDKETSQHFSNPVSKCYGTPYGSSICTTENGVLITSCKDEIYIKMDDAEGIEIHSTEDIDIYSEKDIDIHCKKMEIKSEDKIILQTKEDLLLVDETIFMNPNI